MIVATGHTGYQWDRIVGLTLPALTAYCERHGYWLLDVDLDQSAAGRPPSWGKVPAMRAALHDDPAVVWIDADVLIRPDAPPIHEAMPAGAWQALAFHDVPEGATPNCGVWCVTRAMQGELAAVWASTDLIDHPWWEQAALMRLLGYDVTTWPILAADRKPAALSVETAALPGEWNAHPHDRTPGLMDRAWFRHATPGGNRARLAMLSEWAQEWGL